MSAATDKPRRRHACRFRIARSIHKQELASFRSRVPESNQLTLELMGVEVAWDAALASA